jgi:putative ATP-dependent endonuclease of the OLD family
MIAQSVKFRGHRCFKNEWAGFDEIKPLNVIIGRNNTGKSHLLDLAEALCGNNLINVGWPLHCRGVFDEASLRTCFRENTSDGPLQGNHWRDHGRHFVGVEIAWYVNVPNTHCRPIFAEGFDARSGFGPRSSEGRISLLHNLLQAAKHTLSGKSFRRLLADRDIRAESASNTLSLGPDGSGATNIIRRYILSSSPKLSRNLIQNELLAALNDIFKTDGKFTEIQVKHHDEQGADTSSNVVNGYEVYLGEDKKGLVALSRSGSGLKTVILVLLNLLVVPEISNESARSKSKYVFAFEELENNLHPALLRRLFQYLEAYAVREQASIFLTTHSSVALDLFGLSKNAQIIPHISQINFTGGSY